MRHALQNGCFTSASQSAFVRAAHNKAAASKRVARSTRPIISTQPHPTVTSEDGTKTFRARRHGNPNLPLPPLMDPIAIEARQKFKAPKAEPDAGGGMSQFQRELAENAHAHALATPVRLCNITRARLPSHFLLPFTTVLTPAAESYTVGSGEEYTSIAHPPVQPVLTPKAASELHSSKNRDYERETSTGTTSYILNRRSLIEHLTKKNRWPSLVTPRMQEASAKMAEKGGKGKGSKVEKVWGWDRGMDERVLERLRVEVVGRLTECLGKADEHRNGSGAFIVPSEKATAGMAAVLLLRSLTADDHIDGQNADEDGRVVYDLPQLLGEDLLSRLPLDAALSAPSRLAILRHPRTTKLLLTLDKLRAYSLQRN